MTNMHDRILFLAWFFLPFVLAAAFTACAIADLPDYSERYSTIPSQPAPVPVPVERGGNW